MKFVSCDPGESTGYAVWSHSSLGTAPDCAGTASLDDFVDAVGYAAGLLVGRPTDDAPTAPSDPGLAHRLDGWELLVFEDWALYPWKLEELAWDKCRTARGIGALEYICQLSGRPYVAQPAAIKDAAEAAGAADLFLRPLDPNRHANDAIRHGVYYQLQAGR